MVLINDYATVCKVIGDNIRKYRHQLSISQEELAYRADINKNYLSDAERGVRNLSIRSLTKIANGLKIPVLILLIANNFK